MASSEWQVRAMYDFSGEPGSAELSITVGEILTVTRQDVGEGWWEGTNVNGQTGLFPAAYVEELSIGSQPPSIPPPPLPDGFSDWGGPQQSNDNRTPYGDAAPRSSHLYDKTSDAQGCEATSQGAYEAGDYWEDDEWDDDLETPSSSGQAAATVPSHGGSSFSRAGSTDDDVSLGGSTRAVVPRKNFNRFSPFGKSGLENFLLSQMTLEVPPSDVIAIRHNGYEFTWEPITEPYSCVVASPKKESKLKGLKSFIAYQITPSFNNIQVSRRYKHFDWLHERLTEKFVLIPIPPLPDKQISGRYEEQFIEHRRIQLQAFVDAICRHPVLSRCSVWQHFITCTDEKRWKMGKRKEEKDRLLGFNSLFALLVPEQPLDVANVEQEIDNFMKFIHSMDGAVKSLIALSFDQNKKHQGPYKREYQKIGQTFTALGLALQEATPGSESSISVITRAVKNTGDSYYFIAKLFEDQPKLDWEPLADILHKYKGILASLPDIVTLGKTAIQKRRDCERLFIEHKLDEYQLNEVKRRADLVCYALVAEIHHFHRQLDDYDVFMGNFIAEQITFYKKIGIKLCETWEMFKLPQGRPG